MKSACGIEAVYMCFNGTGIWGGETLRALVTIFNFGSIFKKSLAHPHVARNVMLNFQKN